jgi:hypothetical protein
MVTRAHTPSLRVMPGATGSTGGDVEDGRRPGLTVVG